VTTDLKYYTDKIEPIEIPAGLKTRLLTPAEKHELQRLNGEMGYAVASRPDCMGRVSMSQQNVDSNSCVQHLIDANEALSEMQDDTRYQQLRYEPLSIAKLKLVIVSDASERKKSAKYSQGCYWIFLQECLVGDLGGRVHLLAYQSKKATRVSKSSLAAEVLALNRGSEAGQRIGSWMREIWEGCESVRDLIRKPPPIPMTLVSDAFDCFLSLKCSRPYAGADESMSGYLEALREDLQERRITGFAWIPTGDMVADGGTKSKPDLLGDKVMKDAAWSPSEFKLLRGESIEGAQKDHFVNDGGGTVGDDWWPDSSDTMSWFAGCTLIAYSKSGCVELCPWCRPRDPSRGTTGVRELLGPHSRVCFR